MSRSPEVFFTADTHFGHDNIIKYTSRPWPSHVEMDEALIENFNSVLRKGDILYHLGDLAWSSYAPETFLKRLNTTQVHLVLGNHDHRKEADYLKAGFVWVGQMKKVKAGGSNVLLCHYPIRSWASKGKGTFHLYGHCHGSVPGLDRSMDVGVDTNNYRLYHWEEIYQRLNDLPYFNDMEPKDHHNESHLSETLDTWGPVDAPPVGVPVIPA